MTKTKAVRKKRQPSIELDEARHVYTVGGVETISVTQALDEGGLTPWVKKEQYYLDRGTAVHLATQFDDEGDLNEVSLPEYLLGYVMAWRKFKSESGFVPLLIELPVYSKQYGYAGTLDRVGVFEKKKNDQLILDIKSGPVVPATALQTAAYGKAYKPGKSWRRLGVQLKPSGDYKVHEWGADMFARDFADFVAAHRVAIWKRRNKIQ